MSLSGSVRLSINFNKGKVVDLSSATENLRKLIEVSFADGDGLGEADRIWHDTRTIAASGSEALDLSGSLADIFGDSAIFAKLKGIIIKAAAGNTNNVVVTQTASTGVPLSESEKKIFPDITPGGFVASIDPSAAGAAVTAGTGDTITIANSGSGTSVTYDIFLIGAAAA